MNRYFSVSIVMAIGFASAVGANEPVALNVYPANVQLSSARDGQSVIVQAQFADGTTQDVTSDASLSIKDATLAIIDCDVLRPVADGECELIVSFANQSVSVPVKIENAATHPPVSFRRDVMPIFMKAGCNVGSCHGASRGKDGFRLSLFGYDPAGDYHRLTREISGRRLNLAMVDESLLMQKALGKVTHTGGKRFAEDSEHAAMIRRWLESGAPDDPGEVPQIESLEIYPKESVLDGQGATQQIVVRAKYSDGTDRDVTNLAYFSSNNDNSATVDEAGLVSAQHRGESFIMARFDTHTEGCHFITLPEGLEFEWQETAANNYVDELMHEKFKKLRIQPSDICSDEEFLRRVSLDIAGVLPRVEEYEQFLSDEDASKRDKLVDELLGRKEFVELWVMKWAELLQIRTTGLISYKTMLVYYNWLQERIASEMPMDQLVRELLSASGGTFTNGATNYYQNETDPLKIAENVAQVFMGMRVQCAQCHNHPFDRWTMDDYYAFAAFFGQVGRKQAEDPREKIVFNKRSGEVKHLVGGKPMKPKFLGGAEPDVKGQDRRAVLADWLASSENAYFAKNLANIVWAHFLGRGIIHEVDDVRVSNPPVNQELLDALGEKFAEYNYDFKKLVRDICTSRTYQLGTKTNPTNENDLRNFSHASIRRLRAEVMLDAISQVTGTKEKFQGLPLGARAVQIANGNTSTYFLTSFGRAQRASVCACEVKVEPNLSQALHLLNGDTVNQKIAQGNLIGKLLDEGKTPEDILEELYIRCLSRRPTPQEQSDLTALVVEQDEKQVLEDIFWGLLNSKEFVFNH